MAPGTYSYQVKPATSVTAAIDPAQAAAAEREGILNMVNDWAQAWSSKDFEAYLGFYSNDFALPKGLPRERWQEMRRSRILGKGRINIVVSSPQVALNGETARVRFRQAYVSEGLKIDSVKTLALQREDGQWRIRQELTGG
jgi:ketosteroid isomerase-like protein